MGSGFHLEFESSRKCKCGKGAVDVYREIWWSDYKNDEKGGIELKTTCPNNCENIK